MEDLGVRVYIAEDEGVILSWIKSELSDMGYSVVGCASDGKTALGDIMETEVDMVIMDINMPEMDGLAVIEKISEEKSIPVVIITGYSDAEFIDRANAAGVFGYLIKPIDINELSATLKMAQQRFKEYKQVETELRQMKGALEDRKYIERAKGILMERFGLTENQAMQSMQKKSRNTNKKLARVAKEIIAAEKLLN